MPLPPTLNRGAPSLRFGIDEERRDQIERMAILNPDFTLENLIDIDRDMAAGRGVWRRGNSVHERRPDNKTAFMVGGHTVIDQGAGAEEIVIIRLEVTLQPNGKKKSHPGVRRRVGRKDGQLILSLGRGDNIAASKSRRAAGGDPSSGLIDAVVGPHARQSVVIAAQVQDNRAVGLRIR